MKAVNFLRGTLGSQMRVCCVCRLARRQQGCVGETERRAQVHVDAAESVLFSMKRKMDVAGKLSESKLPHIENTMCQEFFPSMS